MSNLGLWEPTYREGRPFPYGNERSYRIGAEFLQNCRTVEDWGCGCQWFRRVMQQVQPAVVVTGVDGSAGFCDRTADLANYRPAERPEGIFIRHVLEHDYNWRNILESALASFGQRMCLVCFTPLSDEQRLLSEFQFPTGGSCPYLSLPRTELADILDKHQVKYSIETLPSPGTEYGEETIYRIARTSAAAATPQRPSSFGDDAPFVSAVCPTYRRPDLLANAVACFLAQDYPASRRELIILDDAGQYDSQRGDGWELLSVPRRFRSLPEKFNTLAGLAQGDILVVWEDDDIYLPWHIAAHVTALQQGCSFSKPGAIRSYHAGQWHEEAAAGRFHGSIAFTRTAFDTAGGWPLTMRGDFDLQFMSRLGALGPTADPIAGRPPSYIFRWETTGAYHGQAFMHGPDDVGWYQRAALQGSDASHRRLVPQFDRMTHECFASFGVHAGVT
ncbi:MAG: glycosyltransferase family 2 protein [Planctomycetaceae bacterium]|nr:glycosyltransferase family 2 protein [Planctomycetaceae bacterium]